MTLAQLEKRVEHLEKLMSSQTLTGPIQNAKRWLDRAGGFADDAGYEQMVLIGRKYRQSRQPKLRKKPTR